MQRIINALLVCLAVPFLLLPAIQNGYPLLYSDSGTYLIAGFEARVPIDRPILYALFVKYSSLGITAWFTCIAQALIVSLSSYLFIRDVVRFQHAGFVSWLILMILSLSTGLSNFCSQLMPDIFSGLMFFSLVALLHGKLSWKQQVYWFVLLFFLAGMHNSHYVLLALMILLTALTRRSSVLREWPVYLISFCLVLISIPSINKSVEGEWYLSKSSNIFLTGSLVQMGILDDFLSRKCPKKEYYLCQHKDNLGDDANQFIWGDRGVLTDEACNARGGWGQCWKEKNDSLSPMLVDFFLDPRALGGFIHQGTMAWWNQLHNYEIGHLNSQAENSAPYGPIHNRLSSDVPAYTQAQQYTQDLFFPRTSSNQQMLVYLSIGVLIIAWMFRTQERDWLKPLFFFLLAFLMVNAAVCGVLSNPVNRYQGRIIWLLPYLTLLLSALFLFPRLLRKD